MDVDPAVKRSQRMVAAVHPLLRSKWVGARYFAAARGGKTFSCAGLGVDEATGEVVVVNGRRLAGLEG